MDIHTRITGALHIVLGVLQAGLVLVLALGIGLVGGLLGEFLGIKGGGDTDVLATFFRFGTALAGFLALLPTIAGIALLKGSPTGRVFVIVLSAVELLNFPIGTAIGAYSLWALLFNRPASAEAPGS